MLFNSIDFAIFLPLAFIIYWLLATKSVRLQNLFLLFASYIFYGWWDWRFLFLIVFSTLVDYAVGLKLGGAQKALQRKVLLGLSILVNLGLLGFFKYYNFFLDSIRESFSFFGQPLDIVGLNIILPVGISFYTFQTMSYTIDIYRKQLEPTKDIISFGAYVAFFPQLVAGPIERATNLLPQILDKREFRYHDAANGMRQILWGLFKKMVIADGCAVYVNEIFGNHAEMSGSTLFLGAVFFSFQIYGDFSGYSDIAIGVSRLFGIHLMRNFAYPYFSRDIAEFWRRWHISLSTWFRDYVYIPLGGSRGSNWVKIRNTFIIFLVSGFWHGANWTFIIWGLLNAIYFLPLLLTRINRSHLEIVALNSRFPTILEIFKIALTFTLTVLAWIFFRADSVGQAWEILQEVFSGSLFTFPQYSGLKQSFPYALLILFFLMLEWLGKRDHFAIERLPLSYGRPVRWVFYSLLVFLIAMYSPTQETPFIYFQF